MKVDVKICVIVLVQVQVNSASLANIISLYRRCKVAVNYLYGILQKLYLLFSCMRTKLHSHFLKFS